MDDATKVQCGLAPEPTAPIECTGNSVPVQSLADGSWYCDYSGGTGEEAVPFEGDHSFETFCREGLLGPEQGCPTAYTPEDDGPGSLYTHPESPMYQGGADCTWGSGPTVHCTGPNGSYSFEDGTGG
ncbi:hypothetical protein [Saccharopolyspora griseoalba]|uniref:Uncharacterized protein n=1 Tax=Saccharopolyspora griseoalba TaxID=1431848 RepID=A0ABW2LRC0_9PSEU